MDGWEAWLSGTGTQGDGGWWYMGVFTEKGPPQFNPQKGETAGVPLRYK